MFDNEIEWVTRSKDAGLLRREARVRRKTFECVKEYKAEHKQIALALSCGARQVFK